MEIENYKLTTAEETLLKFSEELLSQRTFNELNYVFGGNLSTILNAMKEYAHIKCEEQRELCSESASPLFAEYHDLETRILNSTKMKPYFAKYLPVDIKDRLPSKHAIYNCTIGRKGRFEQLEFINDDGDGPGFFNSCGNRVEIYYWLEEKEDVIVCTKEDLEELIQITRDDAYAFNDGYSPETNKYLESKGIKL